MANSTTIIADLGTTITNGPSSVTLANSISATGLTATGGSGNFGGGSGLYASGTYYGGIMDYLGNLKLVQLKMQESAVLLAKVLVNTDVSSDGTNNGLIAKVLNDLQ